ncbi:MAG TPA: DUF1993 domain-containing protein [Rhodanobacteraceae bacterium]|nr:DUF1993 domain-containing protein [Rhodanobacteraceae bacterium]
MSISMYIASVPVFVRALNNLSHVLKKGEAHAKAKNVDPDTLLQQRLIFDMLPLVKQVQIACDMGARGAARLAGAEPQSFEDNEKTFAEVYSRIERALVYIQSFKREQIDGSEERRISFKTRNGEQNFTGIEYLQQFTLPNLFFHCTTAYDILRVAGADIGKSDFTGLR